MSRFSLGLADGLHLLLLFEKSLERLHRLGALKPDSVILKKKKF
jgi:hypothetical protein